MSNAAMVGWGRSLPANRVTNADLASLFPDIDEEWIVRRTGIRERRIASTGETTSTLAIEAARGALEVARIDPADVDLVICATCTPDQPIPSTAPLVQQAIGAQRAGAFDVNAACAGFLAALAIADSMIRAASIESAVIVGAEVLSRFVDWSDPKTCVLFGDGAGAMVLTRSDRPAGVQSLSMGASGSGSHLIEVSAGGGARPASLQTVEKGEHFIRMIGAEVYRAAVRTMASSSTEALARAGMSTADVDLLIAHQANDRILVELGTTLGIAQEKVFSCVERYGNTSAASVPIAICEAAGRGLLEPGTRLLLTAVGAGLTWSACTALWTASAREPARSIDRMTGALA